MKIPKQQIIQQIIYTPQPNATPDEVLQVLKMFTVMSMHPAVKASMYKKVYASLPENAQRHFTIKEQPK